MPFLPPNQQRQSTEGVPLTPLTANYLHNHYQKAKLPVVHMKCITQNRLIFLKPFSACSPAAETYFIKCNARMSHLSVSSEPSWSKSSTVTTPMICTKLLHTWTSPYFSVQAHQSINMNQNSLNGKNYRLCDRSRYFHVFSQTFLVQQTFVSHSFSERLTPKILPRLTHPDAIQWYNKWVCIIEIYWFWHTS